MLFQAAFSVTDHHSGLVVCVGLVVFGSARCPQVLHRKTTWVSSQNHRKLQLGRDL